MTAPHEESEAWQEVARAWEANRDRLFESARDVSEWIVRHVSPEPGQAILELAAGPGETGFLAAERVGPSGRLISTDLSPAMVDAARRGAEARGLTNVEHRVMDAQAIDVPDASVHGVMSRFALMLVPEPDRVAAGAKRVLHPGGRFAYGVWGPPDRNPWASILALSLMQHGHQMGGNPFEPGGMFSLGAADRNRELLAAAGFSDVVVEEILGEMRFGDLDDYWDLQSSVAGPAAVLIAGLSPDEVGAVKATVAEALESYRSAEGFRLPFLAVGASGRA